MVALIGVATTLAVCAVLWLSLGGVQHGAPAAGRVDPTRWELQAVWAKGVAAVGGWGFGGGVGGSIVGPPADHRGPTGGGPEQAEEVLRAGVQGQKVGGGKRGMLARGVDWAKSVGWAGLAMGVVDVLLFL